MAARTITVKVMLDDADVGRFERNLNRAVNEADGFSGANSKLAAFGVTVGQVGALVGTALVGGLALAATKAVKLAGDLQQSVANISSIKPEIDTRQVFQALNEMSTRIPQSAEQLGAALYDVFSSVNATQAEALKLVEDFAKGAVAAQTDAKTFGTAVMGVVNAYGGEIEKASHIQDVFFNTVKNGVVTGEELAASFGPVAQSAKAAGLNVDELGGFIAGVTKEGGPAAQNINNLNNFLLKMVQPSKDAKEQFEKLKISLEDTTTGGMRPMIEVLTEMRTKMEGMSEFERNQTLAKMFPDAQALTGARVLLSQLDEIKKYTDENAKSSGSAREAYEKMVNTWNSQSTLLQNTALAILRQLGAEILPLITPALKAIAEQLPAGIDLIKRAVSGLKQAWNENWGGIRETTLKVVSEIKKFANENLDGIVQWWKANLPLIKQAVENTLTAMREFWRDHGRQITAFVKDAWELIKVIVREGGEFIGNAIRLALQVINGDWKGVWGTLADIVKGGLQAALNVLLGLGRAFASASVLLVEGAIGAIKGMAGDLRSVGAFIVTGLVDGIKGSANLVISAAQKLAGLLPEWVKRVLDIQSPSKVFKKIGEDTGQGLVDGVLAKASDVAKASRELAKSAIDDARRAAAEAIALANASLKTLQFLKQAEDAREHAAALKEILKLRRELGQDETAALPRNLALSSAMRDRLKAEADGLDKIRAFINEQAEAVKELTYNQTNLKNEEKKLADSRKQWAAEQSQRWLESQRQTEKVNQDLLREQRLRSEVTQAAALDARNMADEIIRTRQRIEDVSIGSIERIKLAELNARLEIVQADDKAKQSMAASRVYIADQTVFHSERATAAVLGHLAKQKGVTESVADAFIGLYDNVFGKLNGLIDGWTRKLGIFGEFVGTLFKGIVNNIANNILGSLFGQNGLLSGIVNRIGGTLGNVLGGILGTGGGGGAAGGIGNIVGGILGIGGGATGGATSGVLGGILGALGIGGTASIAGGTTALAGGAVGLSTIGAGAAGLSGISTGTSLGVAAGAGGSGVAGILGSIGAFATSGLGIATFGIGTAAALIGTWLVKRAKQRRNDEEASGVALQDAVDLIKSTALDIDNDKLRFASDADSQALLDQGILKPFKDFINTLKTASVRDSRLTNQVRDLENLYNDLVGSAIKRQQERLAAAAANPTTSTGTTSGTGGSSSTSDPFNFASTPTTVTIETLTVSFLAGTEDASKVVVAGAQTKDGQAVIVKTVKIAAANGEL